MTGNLGSFWCEILLIFLIPFFQISLCAKKCCEGISESVFGHVYFNGFRVKKYYEEKKLGLSFSTEMYTIKHTVQIPFLLLIAFEYSSSLRVWKIFF